jgi:integrase/recombinase XerD
MAGSVVMLMTHVERYILLRQTLGYKLRDKAGNLRTFARFAAERGKTHVCISTAMEWAAGAPSAYARHVRLRDVAHLARFLHAEDSAHEIPPDLLRVPKRRLLPYIYSPEEIAGLLRAAKCLRESYPFRRRVYATMLGLIAATGLRISEALNLRLGDVLPEGVLQIRHTKFGKSRLLPLHPTAVTAFGHYLEERRRLAVTDDHVFLSGGNQRIHPVMANYTFRRIRQLAAIVPTRTRPPRIHDLRHTFATRALEQCSTRRETVARHFVALSTYLGHANIANTYWYLEATPELMTDIAGAAEALIAREGV